MTVAKVHSRLLIALGVSGCLLGLCCNREGGQPAPGTRRVVAGSAMIECAIRAVAGDAVLVHSLSPAGQCPGHFDLKPGDFEAIVRSEVILRHDYQEYLDKKLQASGHGKSIIRLPTTDPQTLPVNFVSLCRDVAAGLSEAFPELSPAVRENLRTVEAGVDSIAIRAQEQAAPLADAPVVASDFQKGFCEWLGLRVVGEFDMAREMSLKDLERLVRAGREARAVAVVGNLQRGEREGRPIAQELDVPLVLLSNFPLHPEASDAYAQLVQGNIQRLLEGCRNVPDH